MAQYIVLGLAAGDAKITAGFGALIKYWWTVDAEGAEAFGNRVLDFVGAGGAGDRPESLRRNVAFGFSIPRSRGGGTFGIPPLLDSFNKKARKADLDGLKEVIRIVNQGMANAAANAGRAVQEIQDAGPGANELLVRYSAIYAAVTGQEVLPVGEGGDQEVVVQDSANLTTSNHDGSREQLVMGADGVVYRRRVGGDRSGYLIALTPDDVDALINQGLLDGEVPRELADYAGSAIISPDDPPPDETDGEDGDEPKEGKQTLPVPQKPQASGKQQTPPSKPPTDLLGTPPLPDKREESDGPDNEVGEQSGVSEGGADAPDPQEARTGELERKAGVQSGGEGADINPALPKGPGFKIDRRFVTAEELAQMPSMGVIDPQRVRTTQKQFDEDFDNPIRIGDFEANTVTELSELLTSGKVSVEQVQAAIRPQIRLVDWNGNVYTLGHRKLAAFRRAGIDIPYRVVRYRHLGGRMQKRLKESRRTQNGAFILSLDQGVLE